MMVFIEDLICNMLVVICVASIVYGAYDQIRGLGRDGKRNRDVRS